MYIHLIYIYMYYIYITPFFPYVPGVVWPHPSGFQSPSQWRVHLRSGLRGFGVERRLQLGRQNVRRLNTMGWWLVATA